MISDYKITPYDKLQRRYSWRKIIWLNGRKSVFVLNFWYADECVLVCDADWSEQYQAEEDNLDGLWDSRSRMDRSGFLPALCEGGGAWLHVHNLLVHTIPSKTVSYITVVCFLHFLKIETDPGLLQNRLKDQRDVEKFGLLHHTSAEHGRIFVLVERQHGEFTVA